MKASASPPPSKLAPAPPKAAPNAPPSKLAQAKALIQGTQLRRNGNLHSRALEIIAYCLGRLPTEDELAADPNGAAKMYDAKLAAFVFDKLAPPPSQVATLSNPLQIGELASVDDCAEAVAVVTTAAAAGRIGLGEAEKMQRMIERTAKFRWAQDIDRGGKLMTLVDQIAEERGLVADGVPALGWGRARVVKPADDAETVEVKPNGKANGAAKPNGKANGAAKPNGKAERSIGDDFV